jgi:streptogramin lyase
MSAKSVAAHAACDAANADWSSGWIVFVDNPNGATPFQRDPADPAEAVIRAYVRTSPQVAIRANAAVAGLSVTADGTVWLLNGDPLSSLAPSQAEPLRFDFAGAENANCRSLCIATSGRARLSSAFGACT